MHKIQFVGIEKSTMQGESNIKRKISGIINKAMDTWQDTLLHVLSPLYSVDRGTFLRKQFDDECNEVCPVEKFGKSQVRANADRHVKHHTMFTVFLTFLSTIPQTGWIVVALAVLDFIQTQVVTFVLTEKLQYLYLKPEDTTENTSLFDPSKEVSIVRKIIIIVAGYLVRQGLKYAARKVVVRVCILNVLKQLMKLAEYNVVTVSELDGYIETLVGVITALVSGLVAWLLFYPMMVAYTNKLEKNL